MRDRSGFGWLALIVSILLVLLGIATFIWPEAALESFAATAAALPIWTLSVRLRSRNFCARWR